MKPLPADIRSFIQHNHVVGIATLWQGMPWSASCFYAFDEAKLALIILSAASTRHGEGMSNQAQIAGTIAGQPQSLAGIRGIQFIAHATLLAGDASSAAFSLYCQRHPIARLKRADTWQLVFDEIKYTDNLKIFANKTHWARHTACDETA
jgi:uncharacterized protein YhbP (UPF0306 family)